MHCCRVAAALEFLAPEEEQLFLLLVEARERDWAAERVAGVVAGRLLLRDFRRLALVQVRVGVPIRAPSVPVAGAVEALRAALGDDLELTTDGAPVLRLVGVGQDLELGNGVDVGRRHVAAVIAGVDVGDTVDRDVVRVRPLAVDGETADRAELLVADFLRQRAWYEGREVEHGAPVVRDVLQRFALERERAFAARRLQLGHAAGHGDFFAQRADVQRQRSGRKLVVGVDDQVRSLQRLEALERDLERIGVGTDDRQHETATAVGNRRQHVALGAAGHRDRDARQDAALRVLDRSRHGCACRLCVKSCRIARDDEGYQGRTQYALETSDEPHRPSFNRDRTFQRSNWFRTPRVENIDTQPSGTCATSKRSNERPRRPRGHDETVMNLG